MFCLLRYSGEDQHGLDVSKCGVTRTLALQVICSIISYCNGELYPHSVEAPCTSQRLAKLADIK